MQKELITSFNEFKNSVSESATNEAFLVTKRKHGENSSEYVSTNAPIRTRVLSKIAENGSISKSDLLEYFSMLEEELGKKPSWSWMRKNSHLIDTEMSENGEVTYSLTKRGKRVLEVYKNYEKLSNAYARSEEATKEQIAKAKELLSAHGIKTLDESNDTDCPECKAEKWYNANKEKLTEELFRSTFPNEVYEGSAAWAKMFGICCANDKDPDTKLSSGCEQFFKDNPDAKKECD